MNSRRTNKRFNLALPVATVLKKPSQDWNTLTRGKVKIATDRKLSVDWNKYTNDEFLFVHSTIVSSVKVASNDYYIDSPCDELVNSNGNAWPTPILLATFRSFVGKPNYLEHVQVPALSKGTILDAVARPVVFEGANGEKADIIYVDILVAVDRRHADLTQRIESGELDAMSMGCGLAGTKITLPDYTSKNIEEIVVGDEVLTHKGRVRRVTSLYEKKVQASPLYSVEYVSGVDALRLTGEHPVFIATGESVKCVYGKNRPCKLDKLQKQCFYNESLPWKCAGQKKPCGRDKNDYKYDMTFKPIAELRKGDYLAKVIDKEVLDNEELTNEFCRLLGIYAGDGYIGWQWNRKTKEKKYPSYVEFCFSIKEKELAEETKKLLSIFSNNKITEKEVPERSGLYIRLNDKKVAEKLFNHAGEGSWNKKFSQEVMHLPLEKQMKLISGLIDTDGCFYEKTKRLSYTTASEDLFNQIHMLLLRLGVENLQSKVQRKPSGFKKGEKLYDQMMIQIPKGGGWKIKCNKNKGYNLIPEVSSQQCIFYGDYYLCEVKSVNKINVDTTVYNFSVEEDESYCVDRLAVHNCLAHWVTCSRCGRQIDDSTSNCSHLDNEMLQYFTDENGERRIVAELCGRMIKDPKTGELVADPDSVEFIEASWVEKPAFKGAVLNHFIDDATEKKVAKILELPVHQLHDAVDDLFKLRVADRDGMMVLRLAREEVIRHNYRMIADRVAKQF